MCRLQSRRLGIKVDWFEKSCFNAWCIYKLDLSRLAIQDNNTVDIANSYPGKQLYRLNEHSEWRLTIGAHIIRYETALASYLAWYLHYYQFRFWLQVVPVTVAGAGWVVVYAILLKLKYHI